jgi:hypothetical protein
MEQQETQKEETLPAKEYQVYVTYFQFFNAQPTDIRALALKLKEFSKKLKEEDNIKLEFIIGNQYIEPKDIDWLLDELKKLKASEKYGGK